MLGFFDDREDENSYIQLINEVRINISNKMNKLAKKHYLMTASHNRDYAKKCP